MVSLYMKLGPSSSRGPVHVWLCCAAQSAANGLAEAHLVKVVELRSYRTREVRDEMYSQSSYSRDYILYDPPLSVCSKVMSKSVHNIAFYVSPDLEYSRITQNPQIRVTPIKWCAPDPLIRVAPIGSAVCRLCKVSTLRILPIMS